MSWEDIIKSQKRLNVAQYRILREVITDIVEVYDEFERDELNSLIIQAYREHPEINNPNIFKGNKNKFRYLFSKIMNGIGTHENKRIQINNKTKNMWIRKGEK